MSDQRQHYEQIPLLDLEISMSNVRRRETTADIDDLAFSMKQYGLQQPIVVQKRGEKHEILIGQRRFLAAQLLGWDTIDARVLPQPLDELQAKIVSFSENAQRRDLSPKDKADVCSYLFNQLGSTRAVAEQLGVSETTVRRWLGYSGVPEPVKALVSNGSITRPTATRIWEAVPDEGRAVAIATRIAEMRPPAAQRGRILDAAEEYSDRPVDVIFRMAEEERTQREITFVLPPKWASALDRAMEETAREAADIAQEATIDWLNRYTALLTTSGSRRGF